MEEEGGSQGRGLKQSTWHASYFFFSEEDRTFLKVPHTGKIQETMNDVFVFMPPFMASP